MNKLIYLIGFMGSGKSTAGKKLATMLNYSFLDLDDAIENKYRISIPSIFSRFDENAFRILENKVLIDTFSLKNYVVSTGGGTPCYYGNMALMRDQGTTVYLKLHPGSLHMRLTQSKKKRPLIQDKNPDEVIKFIEEMLEQREYFYKQAHITIKGEDVDLESLANLLLNQDHS